MFPQPAAESLNPLVSLGVEHLICCPSTNRPKFSLPKVQVESQRLVLGSRSQTKILPAAPAAIIPLAFTLSSQHIPVLRQMSSGFETGSFASRLGVCQGPPHTRRNPFDIAGHRHWPPILQLPTLSDRTLHGGRSYQRHRHDPEVVRAPTAAARGVRILLTSRTANGVDWDGKGFGIGEASG